MEEKAQILIDWLIERSDVKKLYRLNGVREIVWRNYGQHIIELLQIGSDLLNQGNMSEDQKIDIFCDECSNEICWVNKCRIN